jgi:hypothetical protein
MIHPVIGAAGTAAEEDMTIGIAACDDGRCSAVEVDREKSLRLGRGRDGIGVPRNLSRDSAD